MVDTVGQRTLGTERSPGSLGNQCGPTACPVGSSAVSGPEQGWAKGGTTSLYLTNAKLLGNVFLPHGKVPEAFPGSRAVGLDPNRAHFGSNTLIRVFCARLAYAVRAVEEIVQLFCKGFSVRRPTQAFSGRAQLLHCQGMLSGPSYGIRKHF